MTEPIEHTAKIFGLEVPSPVASNEDIKITKPAEHMIRIFGFDVPSPTKSKDDEENKILSASAAENEMPRMYPNRDEFLTCTLCGKLHRFQLRSEIDCQIYYQAYQSREHWSCSQYPYAEISCDMTEEKKAAITKRGCPFPEIENKNHNGRCIVAGLAASSTTVVRKAPTIRRRSSNKS